MNNGISPRALAFADGNVVQAVKRRLRRRPSVSIDRIGRCHLSRRAMRGLLGAAAAVDERHSRVPRSRESVREQCDDRESRYATTSLRQPIGSRDRSLCLLGCGPGESTTDLAWDGHAAIFECGDRLAGDRAIRKGFYLGSADVDLGRIRQERMRFNTFGDCAREEFDEWPQFRMVPLSPRCAGCLFRCNG